MPAKKTAEETRKAPADVVAKVQHLVTLAHENENEDEARNAALAAVRLMHDNKLSVVPQADIEQLRNVVEGAQALMKRAKDDANQKLLMGVVAGVLFGKKLF